VDGNTRIFIEWARGWSKRGVAVNIFITSEGFRICRNSALDNVNYVIWPSLRFFYTFLSGYFEGKSPLKNGLITRETKNVSITKDLRFCSLRQQNKFRVENMGEEYPLVSIVIVTWNRKKQISECLNSVREIRYPSLEIIGVDNNSTDGTAEGTAEEIEQNFPEVILVRNEENLMAAGGRNAGIRQAKGDFIFFFDSDNVVDKNVVFELVRVISQNPKIGVVGPKMYYYRDPNGIWFVGAEINLSTSKTTYIGHNEMDRGQYDQIQDTGHFPNAFMVRKEVFNKIGSFDAYNFVMHYEESDFCMRANKAGFKVVYVPTAKVWHDIPPPSEATNTLGYGGLDNKQRTYLTARNRIIGVCT